LLREESYAHVFGFALLDVNQESLAGGAVKKAMLQCHRFTERKVVLMMAGIHTL